MTPEQNLSPKTSKQPLTTAIYVHWPWCLSKCPYCDFNAHVWDDIPHQAYFEALKRQLSWMRELTGNRELISVFFGGGTPSLMGADYIGDILNEINNLWNITNTTEITVECNPTSSPAQLFGELYSIGVNRASLGVQSTRQEWLEFLGRKHDAAQALTSLEAAVKAIGNVNADLIFGLPDQDLEIWQQQLSDMTKLGLSHLSCYQLTVEPHTRFFSDVRRGLWRPLSDDRQADFLEATEEALAKNGYFPYEISNFCHQNRVCRHNLHVWQYGDYVGAGAGAHGRITREDGTKVATQTTKHPRNYLAAMEYCSTEQPSEPAKAVKFTPLSPRDAMREHLLAGLRLNDGISLTDLESSLGVKMHQNLDREAYEMLMRLGFLEVEDCRLRLSKSGRPVMDSILAHLLG